MTPTRRVSRSRPNPLGRAALAATLVVALASCGGGTGADEATPPTTPAETTEAETTASPSPTTEATAPFEVEVITETYVDGSRPTEGSVGQVQPDRTIVTRITHPTSGGPYPLIVLSHGLTGHPDEYTDTTRVWAADGFVVVQPTFPLTNREAPGAQANVGDVVNQPGDVSFVIDEVLAAAGDPSSPLNGLVDPAAIGVVGHSLGGATTWAVSFDTATRDDRIDSTVVFAGLTMDMPGGELDLDSGVPLLVMHGDADDVPIELDRTPWEQASSPKWFVTLLGATHVPAFTDDESPYDDLVTRTVLDFWHGTLDDDAEALDRVTADATDPELAVVVEG